MALDFGWLIEHGPCKKFMAGQTIPCPGGPAPADRAMYILLAGRVDVLRKSAAGGTQVAGSLIKGDVFGGREYFTDIQDCTYIAGVDCAVFVITEGSFNDLSWSRPEILFEIFRAAYQPLRKMSAAERTADNAAAAPVAATAAPAKAVPAAGAAGASAAASGAASAAAAASTSAASAAAAASAPSADAASDVRSEAQAKVRAAARAAGVAVEGGLFPPGHKKYPGITKPEFAPLVFPKEYNCPYCKKPFTDFRVFRSKLYESQPVRFDLRRYFKDFQTEWYDVITCPSCFFSTFHTYFTEPKPIMKAKIEKELVSARAEILIDFEAERDIDFVFTSHYLAILCADGYQSIGKQIRAKLWGNLSWLYEDIGDEEMEVYSAEKAAAAYEQIYTETRLTPVQEQVTCLSIAGMQHRAGIDNNLKKFIFSAKTNTMGDKTYAKLAEDFMYELKLED